MAAAVSDLYNPSRGLFLGQLSSAAKGENGSGFFHFMLRWSACARCRCARNVSTCAYVRIRIGPRRRGRMGGDFSLLRGIRVFALDGTIYFRVHKTIAYKKLYSYIIVHMQVLLL